MADRIAFDTTFLIDLRVVKSYQLNASVKHRIVERAELTIKSGRVTGSDVTPVLDSL